MDRSVFNDTYAFIVRDDLWETLQIRAMTDLANYMNDNDAPFTICMENDFFAREFDGFPRVQELYGFSFKPENVLIVDWDEIYNGLRDGDCDIGEAYSTDGRIAVWNFHTLADPRFVFPIYNTAPVIREDTLAANPDLATVLNGFLPRLDDATISQLNARVDIGLNGEFDTGDEEDPAAVARDWLVAADLVDPAKLPPVAAEPTSDAVAPPLTLTPTLPITTGVRPTTTDTLTTTSTMTTTATEP